MLNFRFDGFFIREGGDDCPSDSKSHFAVEMEETASILKQSTNRSLVMIDELGRGTSSDDGAAIGKANK